MSAAAAAAVKVSVCVTAYNRADLLDRTLASLATQTRLPDELVVSDDCSADHTAEVANRWAARFPRFRYLRHPVNLGMPGNLNAAVNATSGAYVADLHDGDTFSPRLLERWEAALDAHPTAGFVFCGIANWPHKNPSGDGVIVHDVAPLTEGRRFYERHMLNQFASIVWGTVMARRAAYDELLPFDDRFGFISDVDMWMRMCLRWDVAYVAEPLIVLDHTPQYRGNGVNWRMIELAREIQLVNIQRFFADDPPRRAQELRRLGGVSRRYLIRRIAGRIRHGDWTGVREAYRLWNAWKLGPLAV